jgi:hypothetical protein
VTERELQQAIVDAARWLGWLVYHTHDSRRSEPGFPDLVMVRAPRLVFVELKRAGGRLTDAQKEWLQQLTMAAETHVWFPDDWTDGRVEETLR